MYYYSNRIEPSHDIHKGATDRRARTCSRLAGPDTLPSEGRKKKERNSLHKHSSVKYKALKIRLESQLIVLRSYVGREDLACSRFRGHGWR